MLLALPDSNYLRVATVSMCSAASIVLDVWMLKWSLGNVTFELLTGLPPFYCQGKYPHHLLLMSFIYNTSLASVHCEVSEGQDLRSTAGDDIRTVEKIMKRKIVWPTGKNAIVTRPCSGLFN